MPLFFAHVNEAMMPFHIFHQTAIVVIDFYVVSVTAPETSSMGGGLSPQTLIIPRDAERP